FNAVAQAVNRALVDEYNSAQRLAQSVEMGASRFLDAATAGGDFRAAMIGLAQDIEKLILQILILDPLLERVRDLFKNAGGASGIFSSLASFLGFGGGGSITLSEQDQGQIVQELIGLGPILGFAGGGSFEVGGAGGIDSQLVAFRATPGENVRVGNQGSDQPIQVNIINMTGQRVSTREERDSQGRRGLAVLVGDELAHDVQIGGPLGRHIQPPYAASPTA